MSDSSDKQLTVGECGRLLPPNLHVLLDTVQKLSLSLLKRMSFRYLIWHANFHAAAFLSTWNFTARPKIFCPPSLSKSSFACCNSSVGTQKGVFRPCNRWLGGCLVSGSGPVSGGYRDRYMSAEQLFYRSVCALPWFRCLHSCTQAIVSTCFTNERYT